MMKDWDRVRTHRNGEIQLPAMKLPPRLLQDLIYGNGEIQLPVVGDFDESLGNRDIIVETHTGHLKRISELHASYLNLQYPLLFPYGEDGYREDICFSDRNASSSRR